MTSFMGANITSVIPIRLCNDGVSSWRQDKEIRDHCQSLRVFFFFGRAVSVGSKDGLVSRWRRERDKRHGPRTPEDFSRAGGTAGIFFSRSLFVCQEKIISIPHMTNAQTQRTGVMVGVKRTTTPENRTTNCTVPPKIRWTFRPL